MRITESRVRQIIREEAHRVLRESNYGMDNDDGAHIHGSEPDAYLTIFGISDLADALDMSPEDFDMMVQDLAGQRMPDKIQFVGGDSGGWGPEPEPYDEENDSYTVMGARHDLERLVMVLEDEINDPAQSIEGGIQLAARGGGLDYEIVEF